MGYINGPIVGLASNAGPVTLTAPQGVAEFVMFFETSSSGASARCAVTCMPTEGTIAQRVNSNVSLAPASIVPLKIDGLIVNSFTIAPTNLDSGTQLKTILQPVVR